MSKIRLKLYTKCLYSHRIQPFTLSPRLPYAAIGKQEIVQKESSVHFATILRCDLSLDPFDSSVHTKSAQVGMSQVVPSRNQPEIAEEERDEATKGWNWRLRAAARRQNENNAGNDINIEHQLIDSLFFSNHSKDTKQTKNLDPKLLPIKLPFAVTGRQEIAQEESIVDFSTIPRWASNLQVISL